MEFQLTGDLIKANTTNLGVNGAANPRPSVAVAANGDFVAIWKRPYNDDVSDNDIYFRRFNADGTPKDSFDRIVTSSSADEDRSAVSMAADGSFVVTWIENRGVDQDRLYFQRFDADGNKLGTAQQVGQPLQREGSATYPFDAPLFKGADVAMFDDGSLVVAARYGQIGDSNIILFFYDKNGNSASDVAATSNGAFRYSPTIEVRPSYIADRMPGGVVVTGEIQFVVSWTEMDSSGDSNVYFKAYDGTQALTSRTIASSKTVGNQYGSSVAVDANGNFVIAWTDEFTSNDRDVRFRRFNASGTPLATDQYANSNSGNQGLASVAMANDGRFAISYSNELTSRTEVKQFAADGSTVGAVTNFDDSSATGDVSTVAINPDGTRLIAIGEGNPAEGVYARLFATPAPVIQFSQESYQASEAGASNTLTLTRTGETFASSQVQFNITGGTATAGADYTSTGFPLTVDFAVGETSKTVAIPILQDVAVEGTETIAFSIASLSNAAIGTTSTATFQILDDDVSSIIIPTSTSTPTPTPTPISALPPTSDRLIGNVSQNYLVGDARDNFILGQGGKDVLTGGGGRDQFVFDTNTRFSKRMMGIDVITDFTQGEDTIVLDRTTFSKLRGAALKSNDFASVKTVAQARKSKALITYVRSSGSLFYNENRAKLGFGVGGQFADLTDGIALPRLAISVVN